jgi:GTP pyrophosphokinase
MKIRFEDIEEKVASCHPEADLDILRRAYVFSAMAHKGQVRSSGEPYLTHPLQVAYILADLRLDVTSVVAGLLHDVLEDTLTSRDSLNEYFGAEVSHLVEGLSKISRITFTSEEEKQAENFRKMLLAMVDDIRVLLVKLADRLHNMRTLGFLSPTRRSRIARETLEIYAPLANRLGLGKIKAELEDLSLKYLEPETYDLICRKLEEQRRLKEDYIADIREILEEKLLDTGIPTDITGRVKHLYSIYRKMQAQGIDVDRVYDYVAFRIITDSEKSCYAILGIIHGHPGWRPVPGRFKDYVAMPKPNYYQSLHTSLMTDRGHPFEVQIRTRGMHAVAEQGIAAHWKYKEGRALDTHDEHRFQWVRRLLDWQEEVKDPREFLRTVKIDLYPEEVYTFTPKGEVKAFPRGATAIDFAYAIHTEIGHQCSGARINGRLVPIKSELTNGDVVEILASPSQHPSRDWLGFVKTPHARHKIRHWLNAQERNRSFDLGRSMVEKEARRHKLTLKALSSARTLAKALKRLGCETLDEFFIQVGYGRCTPQQLLEHVKPRKVAKPASKGSPSRPQRRSPAAKETSVRVGEDSDFMVTLARCCKPIRGDAIIGYITLGKGVSVHTESCPNVQNLMFDPHRRIDVDWQSEQAGLFEVPIVVHTEDQPGMLARLASIIAEEQTNIRDVEARTTGDGKGRISFTLEVQDVDQLERILDRLRSVEGVHHVDRTMGA